MKILNTDEYVNEKLNIQPISKERLKEISVKALPSWSDTVVEINAKRWSEDSVEWLRNNKEGCAFFELGKSDCKTGKMSIVMGWSGGFDDDEPQNPNADGEYRICVKLAYNESSMQSDYEFDWEMPYDENTGDVDDTNTAYEGFDDVMWLIEYWRKNYKK